MRTVAARHSFLGQHVDDGFQASCLLIGQDLPVRAGALVKDSSHSFDLLPGVERVDDIVHEFNHLFDQEACRDLLGLPQVEKVPVQAVLDGTPLVFLDESLSVVAPGLIVQAQLNHLGNHCLE